jgi:hypothetical protein
MQNATIHARSVWFAANCTTVVKNMTIVARTA